MRYWLSFFLVIIVGAIAVIGIAGFQGGKSRKPPIEIFPDMDRQPKIRPQTGSSFFSDGKASRVALPGTIARGSHYLDTPLVTGQLTGSTNFVDVMPLAITAKLLARGRERYQISCLPCHGALADGNGITKKYGMAVVANLHDKRIVTQTDGELFKTITHGKNLMGGYGANIAIEDRWAIIAHLRTLQLARLGILADVPLDRRAGLK